LDSIFQSQSLNIIIGTVFVCLVIIPAILWSVRKAPSIIKVMVNGAAIFAIYTSFILIITLLGVDTTYLLQESMITIMGGVSVLIAVIYYVFHSQANGEKQLDDQPQSTRFCSKCGHGIYKNKDYCSKCGGAPTNE